MADIEPPNPEPKSRGMALWVRLLLFGSLALNLLIVGVVVGTLSRVGPERKAQGPRDRDFAAPYARALLPKERREMSRTLRQELRENRPARGTLSQGYRDASAALRAEPFDPAPLEDILAAQARRAQGRLAVGQAVMLSYLTNMSEAERIAFADRLDAELEKLSKRSDAWKKRE